MSPRYIEVADDIRSEIRSGQTPVGSFLPSEPVLAERMGVSRTTIRAALSHLQRLGIVTRRRGAGTRIEAEEAAPLYVHSMVASGDQLQFAGPTTRHVHVIEEIVADEELAPRLDNRPGRRWLRIGQTRHVADNPTPVCWTDVYVAQKYTAIGDEIRDYRITSYNVCYTKLLRDKVRKEASKRYIEIFEVVTGKPFQPSLEPPIPRLSRNLGLG